MNEPKVLADVSVKIFECCLSSKKNLTVKPSNFAN